jgi:AraC-like DNA-binding protein
VATPPRRGPKQCPELPEILTVGRDRAVKSGADRGAACGSDILSVYLKGGPRYELDGVVFEVSPPVAILIPAGTVDRDLQSGPVDGVFVLFRGGGLVTRARRGCAAVRALPGAAPCVVPFLRQLSAAEALRLRDLVRRIGAVSPMDQQGCLRRAALLLEALAAYCGDRREDAARGIHREAQRLRDLIDARAGEPIALAGLYRELGISAARAATLFAEAFGMSPVAYRLQVRLNRARELLISTRRNVSETAYASGFADPLYFSRVFNRYFGATPSSLIRDFAVTRRRAPDRPGRAARPGRARPGRRPPGARGA